MLSPQIVDPFSRECRMYSAVIHPNRVHGLVYAFFFNDTATTEIYTLSLHDALPITIPDTALASLCPACATRNLVGGSADRKSTRLNSSHSQISYAVFCLKKKKNAKYAYREMAVRTSSIIRSISRSGSLTVTWNERTM